MCDSVIKDALVLSISSNNSEIARGCEILRSTKESNPLHYVAELARLCYAKPESHINRLAAIAFKNVVVNDFDLVKCNPEIMNFLVSNVYNYYVQAPESLKSYFKQILEQLILMPDSPFFGLALEKSFEDHSNAIQANQYASCLDYLSIISLCLSKYARESVTPEMLKELKEILMRYQVQILQSLSLFASLINENPKLAIVCCKELMIGISSIHTVDLPEYFEDNMEQLFGICLALLSADLEKSLDHFDEIEPSEFDILCKEIFLLLEKYAVKYSEEFESYVKRTYQCAMLNLSRCLGEPRFDSRVVAGLSLITVLIKTQWSPQHAITPVDLDEICKILIVPNLYTVDSISQDFETDEVTFARQDLEEFAHGPRRRALMSLIKVYVGNDISAAQKLMVGLEQCSKNQPEEVILVNEIFLVTCCLVKTYNRLNGAVQVADETIVKEFIVLRLIPLIQKNTNNPPVLCSAMSCLIFFRNLLSPADCTSFFELLVSHLCSKSLIVQTFAAFGIERLCGVNVFTKKQFIDWNSAEITSSVGSALQKLISLSSHHSNNEHFLKAIWRVTANINLPLKDHLQLLNLFLSIIISNLTKNPDFHYGHILFECADLLLFKLRSRQVDSNDLVALHEGWFACLENLLAQECFHDLRPYLYQILASLIQTLPINAPQDGNFCKLITLYRVLPDLYLKREIWAHNSPVTQYVALVLQSFLERPWLHSDLPAQFTMLLFDAFIFLFNNRTISKSVAAQFFSCIILHSPVQHFSQITSKLLQYFVANPHPQFSCASAMMVLVLHLAEISLNASEIAGFGSFLLQNAPLDRTNEEIFVWLSGLLVLHSYGALDSLDKLIDVEKKLQIEKTSEKTVQDALRLYDSTEGVMQTRTANLSLRRIENTGERYNKLLFTLIRNKSQRLQLIFSDPRLINILNQCEQLAKIINTILIDLNE